MKKLIFLISIFLIMSCSNDDNNDEPSQYVLDSQVTFSLTNHEGEDLLTPETEGHFPYANINLYYLIDGEKVLAQEFDPQIGGDTGKGMMLISENSPNQLVCFTYSHGDEGLISEKNDIQTGTSIAYLELNEETTDTIKTEWESKEGKYFVNKKVWYNGELKSVEEPFTITK